MWSSLSPSCDPSRCEAAFEKNSIGVILCRGGGAASIRAVRRQSKQPARTRGSRPPATVLDTCLQEKVRIVIGDALWQRRGCRRPRMINNPFGPFLQQSFPGKSFSFLAVDQGKR